MKFSEGFGDNINTEKVNLITDEKVIIVKNQLQNKITEVEDNIPVKLDENGNVVNKKTGEPVGEKIFDIIGEGEPTKDMNPDKEGVMYFDKTSGVIWVCTSNEEDNNIWKSNTGNWINGTISKLDIFGDGSCIALYQLDSGADDTGGEFNGQWKDKDGNVIYGSYEDGKFGKCAKFNGKSYIDIGSIVSSITNKDFTVSLWGKPLNDDSKQELISIDKDKFRISPRTNDDLILINYLKHSDYNYTVNGVDWQNNLCHYLVVVDRENSKGEFYLNGDKIATEDIDIDDFDENVAYLGAETSSSDNNIIDYLEGLIDQVRIFDRTLTDDEVKALYKEGGN